MLVQMIQAVDGDIVEAVVDDTMPYIVVAKRKNGRKNVAVLSAAPVDLALIKRRLGAEGSLDYDYAVDLWLFTLL